MGKSVDAANQELKQKMKKATIMKSTKFQSSQQYDQTVDITSEFKQAELDKIKKQFQRELKSVVETELRQAREARIKQERELRYQRKMKHIEQTQRELYQVQSSHSLNAGQKSQLLPLIPQDISKKLNQDIDESIAYQQFQKEELAQREANKNQFLKEKIIKKQKSEQFKLQKQKEKYDQIMRLRDEKDQQVLIQHELKREKAFRSAANKFLVKKAKQDLFKQFNERKAILMKRIESLKQSVTTSQNPENTALLERMLASCIKEIMDSGDELRVLSRVQTLEKLNNHISRSTSQSELQALLKKKRSKSQISMTQSAQKISFTQAIESARKIEEIVETKQRSKSTLENKKQRYK
ncbi:hypothetical protein FGO68_gene12537 [Halteria grandinella]|uniref:Uncharacterized protein n=1 Tax=Halteria grandinella TaxID=5974 RepID=A0A8J8P107_HALGN|nr:hypothetical protein FGO68_gene12537 [Halteria grandinella]